MRAVCRSARAARRSALTTTSSRWAAIHCWRHVWSAASAPVSMLRLRSGRCLKPQRLKALARRLGEGGDARPALVAQPRPAEIPLSFAQQRLWFLYRLEGPSPTYNIPLALRLTGTLDATALEAALGDVVERHESLRTIFPDTLGVPRQQILEASGAASACDRDGDGGRLLPRQLAAAAQRGFDLAGEPPLRAQCLRLATANTCCCCCCIILPATAGHWHRCGAILRPPMRRAATASSGAAGAAGAVCRLHVVAARCSGARTTRTARLHGSLRSGASAQGASGSDRTADRPAAACGGELSRRAVWNSDRGDLHCALLALARDTRRACSWCCRRDLRRC